MTPPAANGREPLPLLAEVEVELYRAVRKFDPMHSPHEGIAVIEEEVIELRRHVHENTGRSEGARVEAIQVAAMAMRYVMDLCDMEKVRCPRCGGEAGRTDPYPCPTCSATGWVLQAVER